MKDTTTVSLPSQSLGFTEHYAKQTRLIWCCETGWLVKRAFGQQ